MKINGNRANKTEESDDDKKDAAQKKRADGKKFSDLLEKSSRKDTQASEQTRRPRADAELSERQAEARDDRRGQPADRARAAPGDEGLSKKPGPGSTSQESDVGAAGVSPSKPGEAEGLEEAEFKRKDAAGQTDDDGELSPEDQRALIQGDVPGAAPIEPGETSARVAEAQPLQPAQSRHEVTEKLLATIVSEGYVTEDLKGRKVVLMQVDVPGKGQINMRLWRRSSGVELRLRADDPGLASEIRRNRGQLEAGAKERGIHFSNIEVVG